MGVTDANILSQFIRETGLKPEETSKSFVFDCPKCQGRRKLWMYKSGARFVCWKCKETDNYQGRVEYALSDLLGMPVKQVRARLGIDGDVAAEIFLDARLNDFYGDDEEPDDFASETPVTYWPQDYHPIEAPESARGAAYLKGRGVPLWLAKKYGVRYAPEKRRVVFPVGEQERLYGWQERLVVPHKYTDSLGEVREIPKILSSTGIPRERTLMFADRLAGSPHAVLTEGPVDCMKAHFCGGNVAAMGKAVTAEQMNLLLRAGVRRIYLALDPDAALEMGRLAREYLDDVELYTMLPQGRGKDKIDLGVMSFEDVYRLFLHAERVDPGRLFFFLDPTVAG